MGTRSLLFLPAVTALAAALAFSPAPTQADISGTPAEVASGLSTPWETQPLPDGRIILTELPGRVRIIQNGSLLPTPALDQVGSVRKFLGLALDPGFSSNAYVYLYVGYGSGCSSDPGTTGCKNRITRYTLSGNTLGSPLTIYDNIPSDGNHDGGRIKFGPDGKLYTTTGDIHNPALPQDLDSNNGKILRMNADGSVPAGNPFAGSGARQYVWSYGHRHPQGIAWDAEGRLFETEHGPSGESYAGGRCCRDEVNLITPGANYGWPTYMAGDAHPPGYTAPIATSGTSATWAPSGAAIGADGKLYVPTLSTSAAGHRILAFSLNGGSITGQTEHFAGTYGRLRTTTVSGTDLYFNTSNNTSNEKIYRVTVSAAPYAAQWVRQSVSPPIASGDRSSAQLSVDFRNTGSETWSNTTNPVRLAPSSPRDRNSPFHDSGWLSFNRVATFAGRVESDGTTVSPVGSIAPGEVARFQFSIVGPPVANATAYTERFALVAEGVTWFGESIGQYFPITVTPKTYAFSYQGQTFPPATMNPTQRATVTLSLRNEGSATWRRNVLTAFHVGTSRPLDRLSGFANDTWLSPNRVGNFSGGSDTIAPGQTATFSFDLMAPSTPGTYREYFQPVVEGFRFLNDLGIYYQTTVPQRFDYQYVGQSAFPTVGNGGTAVVKLQLKNTGSDTWNSTGPTPVRLATDRFRDRGSGFAANGSGLGPGWLSPNRIKLTRNLTDPSQDIGGETTVQSGQTGEFEFTITGNPPDGRYTEYFTPVTDGVAFMKDIGIYWIFTVS